MLFVQNQQVLVCVYKKLGHAETTDHTIRLETIPRPTLDAPNRSAARDASALACSDPAGVCSMCPVQKQQRQPLQRQKRREKTNKFRNFKKHLFPIYQKKTKTAIWARKLTKPPPSCTVPWQAPPQAQRELGLIQEALGDVLAEPGRQLKTVEKNHPENGWKRL